MKRGRITGWGLVLAAVFLLATSMPASADLIARWNYNDEPADNGTVSATGTQNPYADEGIRAGVAQQVHFGTLSSWGYNDGATPNATGDYSADGASGTADKRYRFAMTATGSLTGLRWNVSTVAYENISVTLGIYGRNALSGQNDDYRFDYSLDGGSTWSNNPVTYSGGDGTSGVWTTFNLSSIAGANNISNFAFRFVNVDLSAAQTLTADWVMVEGAPTVVPIPAAAWLLGSGLVGLVVIRRRMKK
jgi:hypothetical protein